MARNNEEDYISRRALDWAISHISKFGDTDIFPVPFEYEIIKKNWNKVCPELEKKDFFNHKPRNTLNTLVPKRKGYRVARQLDPIDNILILAAIKEVSSQLEETRVDKTVACSYRINTTDSEDLRLYLDDGWKSFYEISKKYIDEDQCKFVLSLDIADFYNQIYLHGVHNQLESAGVSHIRAKSIENFLININAKKSIGLPVGPSFSIILAEIVLNDLDRYVQGLNVGYVRYVDDMRFFCRTRVEMEEVLRCIYEYLFTNLRLTIQTHKVSLLTKQKFREKYLFDPEKEQREGFLKAVKEKMEEVGYGASEDDVMNEHGTALNAQCLHDVMKLCIEDTPYELGYFKAILRMATQIRARSILTLVLENLEILMPVYRDVINYLLKVENEDSKESIQNAIETLMSVEGRFRDLSFQKLWSNYYFYSPKQGYYHSSRLNELKSNDLRAFMMLLSVSEKEHRSNFVSYKESWQNHAPLIRRAIIHASQILPKTERKIWLSSVVGSTDDLQEKCIAEYAKTLK